MIKHYKPQCRKNKNGQIISYQFRATVTDNLGHKKIRSINWKVPDYWDGLTPAAKVESINNAYDDFICKLRRGEFISKSEQKLKLANEANKPTFTTAVEEYIQERQNNKIKYKYNTSSQDRNNLRFAVDYYNDVKVEDINEDMCNGFLRLLSDLESKGVIKNGKTKCYARGTTIKYFSTLHCFFEWCVHIKKYMTINPLQGKKPVYENGEDGARRDYHSIDEINKIKAIIKKEDLIWQLITELFISTGCRRGEALGILWEDIDLEEHKIWLHNNQQRATANGGDYTNPIKDKECRYIYPSEQFFNLLSEFRNENKQMEVYVFYHYKKSRMLQPNEVSDYYKRFGKKCGLKMSPHKFRHTLGNLMADQGVSDMVIAEVLGDGTEVVRRYYANQAEKRKKSASELYNNIFKV